MEGTATHDNRLRGRALPESGCRIAMPGKTPGARCSSLSHLPIAHPCEPIPGRVAVPPTRADRRIARRIGWPTTWPGPPAPRFSLWRPAGSWAGFPGAAPARSRVAVVAAGAHAPGARADGACRGTRSGAFDLPGRRRAPARGNGGGARPAGPGSGGGGTWDRRWAISPAPRAAGVALRLLACGAFASPRTGARARSISEAPGRRRAGPPGRERQVVSQRGPRSGCRGAALRRSPRRRRSSAPPPRSCRCPFPTGTGSAAVLQCFVPEGKAELRAARTPPLDGGPALVGTQAAPARTPGPAPRVFTWAPARSCSGSTRGP